jgi:hypothetical protein
MLSEPLDFFLGSRALLAVVGDALRSELELAAHLAGARHLESLLRRIAHLVGPDAKEARASAVPRLGLRR